MSPKYAKDQPAGFVNRIQKVAIVGVRASSSSKSQYKPPLTPSSQAAGRIGSYFTKHLLATNAHTITALTRPGSSTTFPAGVHRVEVDYTDLATLTTALRGQDFLIITIAASAVLSNDPGAPTAESQLIAAAAAAGVPYVMPNAFGPDPLNASLGDDQHLAGPFRAARKQIEELGVSSWVALSPGFWYEWSLVGQGGLRFGCGIPEREMTFFDQGEEKITTATWDQCGRAVAGLLGLRVMRESEGDGGAAAVEDWANGVVYISSFRVSQKDMFESVKRVTGTTEDEWTVRYVDGRKRYEEAVEKMKKGDYAAFSVQMYTRIFFPTGDGDATRRGLANEVLGLPEEDIDEATREGLRLEKLGLLSISG